MSREVRRVPVDFDWPIGKVWSGYLLPEKLQTRRCERCDGGGHSDQYRYLKDRWYGYLPFDPSETGSTPFTAETPEVRHNAVRNVQRAPQFYGAGEEAIRREADRLAHLFNQSWSHHLRQEDVDALIEEGRLYDFTHRFTKSAGFQPIEPAPVVTAEQVNLWSLTSFGHDAVNCWIVVGAECGRRGWPTECKDCAGTGDHEVYPGQRAEAEAWQPTPPPEGDGWQLWETVSEGSPKSPVFPTSEGLVAWMSHPDRGDQWVPPEHAAKFVQVGWAPSSVGSDRTGLVSGVEWIGSGHDDQ